MMKRSPSGSLIACARQLGHTQSQSESYRRTIGLPRRRAPQLPHGRNPGPVSALRYTAGRDIMLNTVTHVLKEPLVRWRQRETELILDRKHSRCVGRVRIKSCGNTSNGPPTPSAAD
jgi:hypothetical protein